jgi:general secretion pathway protein G
MNVSPQTVRTARRLARGFTLLELMVVLLIIGLLMSVAAFNFIGQGEEARKRTTVQSMKIIDGAIKQYQLSTGAYPPTIAALVPKYLEKEPLDAWKRPFVYFVSSDPSSNKPFTLMSTGKSGEQGGKDGIDFHTDGDKILSGGG